MAKNKALASLLALSIGGCQACPPAKGRGSSELMPERDLSRRELVLDIDAILLESERFTYRSELKISLLGKKSSIIDEERVEILAKRPMILFKKKIDDTHFIEIFNEGNRYLSRNQNGAFRDSSESGPMLKDLLRDGLNLTSWMLAQLGAHETVKAALDDGKDVIGFEVAVPIDSPLRRELLENDFRFSSIKESMMRAKIRLSGKDRLPITSEFKVFLMGGSGDRLEIEASSSLDLSSAVAIIRQRADVDEPIDLPVNISRGFMELLKRQGDGG